MSDVKFIEFQNRRILLMDFSDVKDDALLSQLAARSIASVHAEEKPHSVLAVLDFSGTRFNRNTIASMKRMSRNNGPFMKSVAFVGLPDLLAVIGRLFLRISGRKNHRVFADRGAALRWLAQQ